MTDTEPDVAERVALGAALAAPIPHASDPIARAVTAEKERIARVAEDLGASYGPGASFADYLRGQSATTTPQQGDPS